MSNNAIELAEYLKFCAPILTINEYLERKDDIVDKDEIFLTGGCFDLKHVGHDSILLGAKRVANLRSKKNKLLVVVESSEQVIAKNGVEFSEPIIDSINGKKICSSQFVRAMTVAAVRGVDIVVLAEKGTLNSIDAIGRIKPDYYIKGGDRKDWSSIPEWDICITLGIEIISGVGLEKQWGSANMISRVYAWMEYFSKKKVFFRHNKLKKLDKLLKKTNIILFWNNIWREIDRVAKRKIIDDPMDDNSYEFMIYLVNQATYDELCQFLSLFPIGNKLQYLFYLILERMGVIVKKYDNRKLI